MRMCQQKGAAMKTVLITGVSSGIGKALAIKMLENNMKVIGISRNSSKINHPNFINHCLDLMDLNAVENLIKKLLKEENISILVNNAGVGFYGLHEELNPSKIHELITVNLEAPLLITNLVLRNFKKQGGIIVNISSVTAHKSNPHGAAYGATKAGLSSFSDSIFDEARKHGVRVITIEPDMTDTNLYRNADFTVSTEDGCYLTADNVADAVIYAINSGCVTHMELKPQFHRISRKER